MPELTLKDVALCCFGRPFGPGRMRMGQGNSREIQRWNRCLATVLRNSGETSLMHGVRYDRILASTALALILAAPLGGAFSGANAAPPRPPGEVYSPWWGGPVRAPPARVPQKKATAPKSKPTPAATAPAAESAAAAPAAAATDSVTTGAVTTTAPAATQPSAAPAAEAPAATPAVAAEPPAPPPDPLASLDPADRPFAEKIRDMFASKTDKGPGQDLRHQEGARPGRGVLPGSQFRTDLARQGRADPACQGRGGAHQ
jgi:hypothetical protein